ncbi:DUF4395 family protein [Patescibacteria group bacterium]|nr:DUF4395 family protein [Patescibacteria group bacterium]MBU1075250.1 DUF4395 family protein [Patescibacteria group bacterium]MBU1952551.1 DUF4395 family protein [Patescibacteria group bacterium]
MQQCSIYDKSLKFSRATYGVLVLLSFFIHNKWLVLVVAILAIFGAFSLKLNIPYQLHALVSHSVFKKKKEPIQKELGELNFVSAATGVLLLIGFLLLHFTELTNFAWIYILIVDLMIFLACLVGFCVATLMYILLKKIFTRKNQTHN